jgi:hypothetical protein
MCPCSSVNYTFTSRACDISKSEILVKAAQEVLRKLPELILLDDPENKKFPTPANDVSQVLTETWVGRVSPVTSTTSTLLTYSSAATTSVRVLR